MDGRHVTMCTLLYICFICLIPHRLEISKAVFLLKMKYSSLICPVKRKLGPAMAMVVITFFA